MVVLWSAALGMAALAASGMPASEMSAENDASRSASNANQINVDQIIEDFRARLGIAEPVQSFVVDEDELLVSVRRLTSTVEKVFLIQFEREFLSSLNDEELRAVVAHELGHVWIFTHHPFLQTEALANKKAMELVSRDVLIRVYEKVWQRGGKKGNLEDFLARVD
jgi:hypothetical protein